MSPQAQAFVSYTLLLRLIRDKTITRLRISELVRQYSFTPYFITQSIRTLIESGIVDQERNVTKDGPELAKDELNEIVKTILTMTTGVQHGTT